MFHECKKHIKDQLKGNLLRTNIDKRFAYHLKDTKEKIMLIIEPNTSSMYLGGTLDRTLSYKHHMKKEHVSSLKMILKKLVISKWSAHPYTIKSTASALCYSTTDIFIRKQYFPLVSKPRDIIIIIIIKQVIVFFK